MFAKTTVNVTDWIQGRDLTALVIPMRDGMVHIVTREIIVFIGKM
jgi:hypothetical protein